MANVRKATVEDIPALLPLWAAMHAESPHYRDRNYSERKVYNSAFVIIGKPDLGGILVAESEGRIVGVLAFVVAEDFFGHDKFTTDLVVYVTPEKRGGTAFVRLVTAYEKWADELGIVEKFLGVSTGIDMDKTVDMLERLDYEKCSTGLRKRRCVTQQS